MVRRKGINDEVPNVDDEDNSAGGGLLPLRPAGAFGEFQGKGRWKLYKCALALLQHFALMAH
jgi:hypothetical protein